MKIWVDDIRPAPQGYVWVKSVNEAISLLDMLKPREIDIVDIDHDAGDYANDGGDYVRVLDHLEEMGGRYRIRIHSMNPVGIEKMRRIIEKNGWIEVK